MDSARQSSNNVSETGWQVLGEIKLPEGPAAGRIISVWLLECTRPLNLGTGLADKVRASALGALAHTLGSGDSSTGAIYVVLRVYVLQEPTSRSDRDYTWGFFRIEKNGSAAPDEYPPDSSIELYLYPEGY